ncbi:glycoside hydrolase family 30 protein [Melioribacter sp. Ez-97]|uniref:glycoside hydrolase family 30 protein n=1 Tax=Melioribacter sp. Ez-97 TaxID=3423434 RepID=UPI003EDA2D6C
MNLKKRNVFIALILTFFFFALNQIIAQGKEYKEAKIFITSESGNLLMKYAGPRALEPLEQPDENYPTIIIDPKIKYQEIIGFGGAFTDAAAINFYKLNDRSRKEFLEKCFDYENGFGFSLCRTTIHSCDYSDEMYTYDDVEGDKELKHFSIAHDKKYRIPFLQEALRVSRGKMKLFASPWSPPAWMKTNGTMLYGGKLKSEYRKTWAEYIIKYLKAYRKEGIDLWGLTVQNEPLAVQVWESCIFTAQEEKNFVRDYLGPELHSNGYDNIKLLIWDHNRGLMYQRAKVAYDDSVASKYIWGMGFHWYVGDHFDNVRIVHDAYPDKGLLFTEGSVGGSWEDAFNLAKNVIIDLNNWTRGWVFWNLLLDENGGPRHAGGEVPGNIAIANSTTGEVEYNPPFYTFGHFSKFIRPGARRIATTSSSDYFIATAFQNSDGTISVTILNLSEADRDFQVWFDNRVIRYKSPPHALITIIL